MKPTRRSRRKESDDEQESLSSISLLFRKQLHEDVFLEAARTQLKHAKAKMTVNMDVEDEQAEWVKISNIPSSSAIENLLSSCFKELTEKVGEEESKKVIFDFLVNQETYRINSMKIANFKLDNVLKRANIKSTKKKVTKRKAESSVGDDNNVEIVEQNEPSTSNQVKKKVKNVQNTTIHSLKSIGILFKSRELQNDFYKRSSSFLKERAANIQMFVAPLDKDNPCDNFCRFIKREGGPLDKVSSLMLSSLMTTILADMVAKEPESFLDIRKAAANTYDVMIVVQSKCGINYASSKNRINGKNPIDGFNLNDYVPK